MATIYSVKGGVLGKFLKDRVGTACEADGAACKGGSGRERSEYALSYVDGGDVTDEVEAESR